MLRFKGEVLKSGLLNTHTAGRLVDLYEFKAVWSTEIQDSQGYKESLEKP